MLKRMVFETDGFDPAPTLLHHLETGNDVIRTDAVRAMAGLVPGDDRVRRALLAALRDDDPDVRSDAMDALSGFAQPEDAPTIRESLIGDPVREIKLAAIALLVQLQDRDAIPVLHKLALDRCEDEIAWEDGLGLWDEWLDIQTACIRALGDLQATDTVRDILAARDDEYGQNLDLPVCDALSQMGSDGMVWLLSIAQTETGLARKRVLETLARMDSDALEPHLDFLLKDDNFDVRKLALPHMPVDDPKLAELALNDPHHEVRLAALLRGAAALPDIAVAGVSDTSPAVQAAALDHLTTPVDDTLMEALEPNLQAWLVTDDGVLSTAVARNWLRLGMESTDPLEMLIRNPARPLGARLAAVDSLAGLEDVAATDRLIAMLPNPAQQVRTKILTHLLTRAATGDSAALDALSAAAEGLLLSQDLPGELEKTEALRLHVTKDGEIAEVSKAPETHGNMSTLEAIQINRTAPKERKGKGKKTRKRQPIEGPADVAHDLSRQALGLIGQLSGDQIGEAIRVMMGNGHDDLRLGAYRAVEARAAQGVLSQEDTARIATGMMDRTQIIRSIAAHLAGGIPELHQQLSALMSDPDALVRVAAVPAISDPAVLFDCLNDPDTRVRQAAFERLLQGGEYGNAALLSQLMAVEAIGVIGYGGGQSASFLREVLARLGQDDLPAKDVHVLLMSLA